MNLYHKSPKEGEEEFSDFTCPHCQSIITFPSSSAGEVMECVRCGEPLIVPAPGVESGLLLPIPIRTERLTLRRLQMADVDDLVGMMSEPDPSSHGEWDVMEHEQIEKWLEADALVKFTSPEQLFYLAIVHNETNKVIGWLSLSSEQNSVAEASVYVAIDQKHRRKGFGAETLRAVLDFCFRGIQLHRVTASCDGRNVATQEFCTKLGMRYEAGFVENRRDGEEWADTAWYAMLEREFLQEKAG